MKLRTRCGCSLFDRIQKVIRKVHGSYIHLRLSTEKLSSGSGSPETRNRWRLGAYPKELLCFACPILIPWPPLLATVGNEAISDVVRQMLRTCAYTEVVISCLTSGTIFHRYLQVCCIASLAIQRAARIQTEMM